MFDVGSGELLLVLLVALLLFGGQLPDVVRSVGRSVGTLKRGFEDATRPLRIAGEDMKREVQREIDEGDRSPPPKEADPPG